MESLWLEVMDQEMQLINYLVLGVYMWMMMKTHNHRIVEWKKGATSGQVVAGGNGAGNQNNQLNTPTSVILNKKGDCFIISDYGNKRIVRWPRQNGTDGQTIISNVICLGYIHG